MSDHQSALSEQNQKFFDSLAISANRPPWMKDLVSQIQSEVLSRLDWLGIPTPPPTTTSSQLRLLDYACGSGELSHTFLPYLSSARGIDISASMVAAYNALAHTSSVPPSKMYAVQGDLLSTPADAQFSSEEWHGFNIATMSMALHHVSSPEDCIQKLVARLKEGGVAIFIDWKIDDSTAPQTHHTHHHAHDHQTHQGHGRHFPSAHNIVPGSEHTITRAGFTEKEMRDMLLTAGCDESSIGFMEFSEKTRLGDGENASMMTLFLAKGRQEAKA
ncbi:MAG: hypothetical protein Q9174_005277 [Haloplaca sp. 1 TL-2023]